MVVTSGNLRTSLGALVIGGLVATALSGVVVMQSILYARVFENDTVILKLVVTLIFLLDIVHTCMVWAADWQYLVASFGNTNITDHVFWTAGITIALTAITTFCVHIFFSYRLLRLSRGNLFITVPMVLLALGRLVSAIATSAELIRLGSYYEFYTHYRWLFTLGLVLSTAADITITTGLCLYLRRSRHGGSGRLDHILSSVTLYTVENGMITCIATVLSLIFAAWRLLGVVPRVVKRCLQGDLIPAKVNFGRDLFKPHVLIYLGLHYAICKLYANSFLASMNARKLLRAQNATSSSSGHRMPVIFAHHFTHGDRRSSQEEVDLTGTKLQITVDRTINYTSDDPSPPSPHADGSKLASSSAIV